MKIKMEEAENHHVKETHLSPVLQSFQAMDVSDEHHHQDQQGAPAAARTPPPPPPPTAAASALYGKLAGVGSSLVGKFSRQRDEAPATPLAAASDTDGAPAPPPASPSVTGYVAEKLRPGEDDKALKEAIVGSIRKNGGGGTEKSPVVAGPSAGGGGSAASGAVEHVRGAVASMLRRRHRKGSPVPPAEHGSGERAEMETEAAVEAGELLRRG